MPVQGSMCVSCAGDDTFPRKDLEKGEAETNILFKHLPFKAPCVFDDPVRKWDDWAGGGALKLSDKWRFVACLICPSRSPRGWQAVAKQKRVDPAVLTAVGTVGDVR